MELVTAGLRATELMRTVPTPTAAKLAAKLAAKRTLAVTEVTATEPPTAAGQAAQQTLPVTELTATVLADEQSWRQGLVYSGVDGKPVGSHLSSLTTLMLMAATSMGGRAAASRMPTVAGQTEASDHNAMMEVHERKPEGERQLEYERMLEYERKLANGRIAVASGQMLANGRIAVASGQMLASGQTLATERMRIRDSARFQVAMEAAI